MLDFDQVCILIAFILAVASIQGYRLIATTLFLNFMITEAAAKAILRALGGPEGDPAWPLYSAYVVISGITILFLRYLKASPALYAIMLLYAVYNLLVVIEFPLNDYVKFKWFNENRKSVAEAQMIIELSFMFMISRVGTYVWSLFKPDSKYNYFIDRFFSDCFRMGSARLV